MRRWPHEHEFEEISFIDVDEIITVEYRCTQPSVKHRRSCNAKKFEYYELDSVTITDHAPTLTIDYESVLELIHECGVLWLEELLIEMDERIRDGGLEGAGDVVHTGTFEFEYDGYTIESDWTLKSEEVRA